MNPLQQAMLARRTGGGMPPMMPGGAPGGAPGGMPPMMGHPPMGAGGPPMGAGGPPPGAGGGIPPEALQSAGGADGELMRAALNIAQSELGPNAPPQVVQQKAMEIIQIVMGQPDDGSGAGGPPGAGAPLPGGAGGPPPMMAPPGGGMPPR